jgi:hypothetical protein
MMGGEINDGLRAEVILHRIDIGVGFSLQDIE